MASRQIAIRITIDNRDAINAAKAQTIATQNLNQATQQQTHLQAGLTQSFLKGNLAARAISVAYINLRNAFQDMVRTGVEFQFTMAKINAISGENAASVASLSDSIREIAKSSLKSAPEIAKVALEMNKLGLTNGQVKALIGSVTTLGVALDEDLVVAGETVVQILNTYGKSVSEGKKVSEQLAFTVAASALDLQKFGTAFSYVGGTAAVAGVKFEDLAGAMDYLSNAGIKSSTIGTQLRRIILGLSNENSDASKAIGGTVNSLGGLIPALQKLDQVLPKESDKRIAALDSLFGKTASSVAALLLRDTEAVADFSKRTSEATGNLERMQKIMDGTFTAAISRHANAWRELGMVIGDAIGPLAKGTVNVGTSLVDSITKSLSLETATNKLEEFMAKKEGRTKRGSGFGDLLTADIENMKALSASLPGAEKAEEVEKVAGAFTKVEDQIKALKASFESLQSSFEISEILGEQVDFQSYIAQYQNLADSLQNIGAKKDAVAVLREIAKLRKEANDERQAGVLSNSSFFLDFSKSRAPLGDKEAKELDGRLTRRDANAKKYGDMFDKSTADAIRSANDGMKEFNETLMESSFSFNAMQIAADGVNGSLDIFSAFIAEGLFSEKDDPFKGISDAFGDFAKKIIADLVAMTLKLLVFRAILFAVTGGKSGFLGGFGFASTGGTGFLDGLLKGMGGTKLATGTNQVVRQPTLFMAGEAGPERVSVGSRAKLGAGSGGVTYIIQGDVYDYDKFQRKVKEATGRNQKEYV